MPNDALPTYYVDGVQIALTEHGAKLFVQTAFPLLGPEPAGQMQVKLKTELMLNFSHEHLKLLTIYMHRQLVAYEKDNEVIPLNKKVIETQKIDLKAEW